MNQCLTNNGGCAHNCTNELPGFTCSCRTGYNLDTDKRSCVGESFLREFCIPMIVVFIPDINECEIEDICLDECFNTDGSYTCLCTSNTILDADGQNCIRKKQQMVISVDVLY